MNILENFPDQIYQQFLDHLKKKYPDKYSTFTPAQIHDNFTTIFMFGLTQAKRFLKINRSCDLLYNGHPAREDMIERLGNILFELQSISSYPIVPAQSVGTAIKKIIGLDKRYTKKYQDWIITLSNHQSRFNSVDLTWIVSVFPEELLIGKEW